VTGLYEGSLAITSLVSGAKLSPAGATQESPGRKPWEQAQ